MFLKFEIYFFIGPQHQAGSDSLLTGQTFFKMKEMFFEDDIDDSKYCGHLYGLGTNFVVNKNNNSSSVSLASMGGNATTAASTAASSTTTTTSTASEATTTTTASTTNTNMDVGAEASSSEDRDGADSSEKSAEDP